MKEIILTNNLAKHYGSFKAVDSISLSVSKGEIYGFLGLNGAGKTTTIQMLLGMIRPTAGECWLRGVKIADAPHSIWNHVGHIVEIPYSYPDLTVVENLEIIRRLRFLPDSKVIDNVIEKLKLTEYKNRQAKKLSLGNAQRLGIAKAIIHNPDILIIDEPANGLDPAGIVEIRNLLLDLAHNHNVTIFISSHILGEISKFATRIGIIHHGKLIQELDARNLKKYRTHKLVINTKDNNSAQSVLTRHNFNTTINQDGLIESLDDEAIEFPEKVNQLLVHNANPPSLLYVDQEDLESYFLRVINQNQKGTEL